MDHGDIRHQKYLEPIVRFLYADIKMCLDPAFPEAQKKHRLSGALIMLERVVNELDEVNRAEGQRNAEGLAAAVVRRYEAETRVSASLTDRVVNFVTTEVDEARLRSFLEGTQELAEQNMTTA